MKALPLVLTGSLIVNAAFVVALVRPNSTAVTGNAAQPETAVERVTAAAGSASAIPRKAAAEAAQRAVWHDAGEDSLPQLVARLRAEGCPPAILRAIVAARVHEQFAARRRELIAGVEDQPYWKGLRLGWDPKIIAAQRELRTEQMNLMKELLGADATQDDELAQYARRRQFGDVSAAKAEQLQSIAADYSELRSQIYADANGILMPEDREKIAFLERELRNDYAKILTSVELENYELRSSSTAQSLRSQLTTFQPTEAEFRALFRAARATEDQSGGAGIYSLDQAQQRQTAFLQAASGSLSPERLAELTQATDPRNQMLNRVVARYELPTTVVPQVTAVQQAIQQRAATIRRDRALSAAERTVQLNALVEEATVTLTPLLGTQAFEAYKQYGGTWMRNLVPPATNSSTQTPANPSTPTTTTGTTTTTSSPTKG